MEQLTERPRIKERSARGPFTIDVDAILRAAQNIKTIEEFKDWTRRTIRPIFPHETLACGQGHLNAGGVALDYVVTVDYPIAHLLGIRNRAGGIDTPILRRGIATLEPQLFEADDPWPDIPERWMKCFCENDMRNTAAQAIIDTERCVGTYHSFHRIPGRLGGAHAEAVKRLAPVMHEVLYRVIGQLNLENKFATRLAGLSSREKQIARWVRLGKTNSEIASLSSLSENTVKHHLTAIFTKLELETRAELVRRMTEHEAQAALGFGTKIL
jgi:DNA-binding CsgD family transcriptional regulator